MSLSRFSVSLPALVALLLPAEASAVTLSMFGPTNIDCPGMETVEGYYSFELAWDAGVLADAGSVGEFSDAVDFTFYVEHPDLDLMGPYGAWTAYGADIYFTADGDMMFASEGMTPVGFDFGFSWAEPSSLPATLPGALPLDGSSLVGWFAISEPSSGGACTLLDQWREWNVEIDYDGDGAVTYYRDGVEDCDWYQACDICPFDADNDLDGDGICGDEDVCPADALNDADGDGICGADDVCPAGDDTIDADGDGIADACDVCPADPADDADGDGLCGNVDPCPLDADDDLDGDGICGDVDLCPDDATNDADGDGICGASDVCALGDDTLDADGDGTADACDACPDDAANDADADGLCADDDLCPLDADDDLDGDGYCADEDVCPADAANDADGDGMCADVDPCPVDAANDGDGDGICESADNCDGVANSDQLDSDADGIGDACETDGDADGVIDDLDNCPLHPNPSQADSDGDFVGDACDDDEDADGVPDDMDLCLGTTDGPVGLDGCSLDDACPCDAAWKNKGAYQSCIARTSAEMEAEGVLNGAERSAAVSAAAQSTCGGR